jgi:hypothetical protein
MMTKEIIDYLLALAALSLSFVGFSTIVVVLRQALGSKLSQFDILLVRFFIESGFAVTGFSLLPPMLNVAGLDTSTIWRLSSAIAALMLVVYLVFYLRRRQRTPGSGPIPVRIYVNSVIDFAVIVGLILNVGGWLFKPSGSPYIIALSWTLVQSGLVFLQTLHLILESSPGDKS